MCGVQTCSAADIARELDIHWVEHRIVWNQLDYREVCVYWVTKNPKHDNKSHCMGLPCICWTYYTDQREHFWIWNMVNYTKPDTRKRMCDRKTIIYLQQRKWKNFHQEQWPWQTVLDHKNVLLLNFLDHGLTLPDDSYCSTLRLWQPFFCKLPQLFHQVIVPLHENARHHTPNWTAVYGCMTDRLWISPNLVLSVLSLTASLKHLAGKWLQ